MIQGGKRDFGLFGIGYFIFPMGWTTDISFSTLLWSTIPGEASSNHEPQASSPESTVNLTTTYPISATISTYWAV